MDDIDRNILLELQGNGAAGLAVLAKVAGLSVITNLAAGIEGASPSHDETKREGAKAAENMKALVTRFLKDA